MRWFPCLLTFHLVVTQSLVIASAADSAQGPIAIDSRRELFVDDFLIDRLRNVRLELQHPQPQEISFACDQPWEGNTCIYFRIIPEQIGRAHV